MNTYKNVFVAGSIAYDTIMNFPNEFQSYFHPERLHQINVSFVVDKLEKQLGGTGTNFSYNISKILNNKLQITNKYQISNNKINAKPQIKLLGSIGKDGKEFISFFNKNKIDVNEIIIDKKLYTATGSVITDTKNNQIWGFYYGASEKIPYFDFKKINKETDLLVISANHQNSFLYFQKEAIKNKIPYFYDPGMTLTWITDKDLRKGVINCRYLVGNDYEIAMIMKRLKTTVNELTNLRQGFGGQASCGLKIVTTLGEEGVRYEERVYKVHKVYKVKSYQVRKVIDPTGAGDAWRGGFVAGLLMDYSIKDCLKLGNVMASFAIEKYGTVNHRPTKKEIEKRMKSL